MGQNSSADWGRWKSVPWEGANWSKNTRSFGHGGYCTLDKEFKSIKHYDLTIIVFDRFKLCM